MNLLKTTFVLSLCFFFCSKYNAQISTTHSLKATVSLGKRKTILSYAFAVNNQSLHPKLKWISYHLESKVNVIQNGLSENIFKQYKSKFLGNIVFSGYIFYNWHPDDVDIFPAYAQLFNPNYATAVSNHANGYIGIGTSYITAFRKNCTWDISNQYIGHFIVKARRLALDYYNDGGWLVIQPLRLGDLDDKQWTGGLSITYRINNDQVNPLYALYSFDKYTGYTPLAFELSSILSIKNVYYKTVKEAGYNQNRTSFGLISSQGIIKVSIWNSKFLELQDIIHKTFRLPFHPMLTKPYLTLDLTYHALWEQK